MILVRLVRNTQRTQQLVVCCGLKKDGGEDSGGPPEHGILR